MTYLATKNYKLLPMKTRLNKIKRQVTGWGGEVQPSINISYSIDPTDKKKMTEFPRRDKDYAQERSADSKYARGRLRARA